MLVVAEVFSDWSLTGDYTITAGNPESAGYGDAYVTFPSESAFWAAYWEQQDGE